ncbi:uncharacterized protein LOC110674319 [Aedes aegypti]|uniref:Uncharacterized protein n=1 Tax=Aedes aegypti TaxID=7159 RepID=A0A6I8TYW7_AEDAE|nr:uncharacterized protein LOC110674319 [Aedes aegypti]
MHLHFLLDEVHLPDSGAYGRPKDTFAINVTLEVPYVRYRLEKVQVLNCYVTGHDPSKAQSTPPTEQNTDEMVSSSSAEPSQESGHAETKKQHEDIRGEEPDDWEWEQQSKRQHLDGFYDDDDEKEGRGRLQGNDEAAEVYADDDYGTDSDDTSTEARKQHFSNYHRYHQNRIGPTPGETLQWTTQSSISHSTNRRHLSQEDANEAYFYDEDYDGKMTGGNANDADFYDQHNHFDNNYCHIERDTFSRTARSGGRQSSQLKR